MLKNILIVNATYFPDLGGSGIMAKNMAEKLKKEGYNITVFCGGKINKIENIKDIKIIRNNTKKENSPYVVENYYNKTIKNKFLEVVKENKIEIIHFHSIQGLGANLIELSLNRGIKTILTMHDFWWACPLLFLNDEYLSSTPVKNHHEHCTSLISKKKLIDRKKYLFNILSNKNLTITTVSEVMKKTFDYMEFPNSSKYVCVENGINKDFKKENSIKNKPNKKIQFAYFGGENIGKGFDLIFKASKLLKLNTNNFEINLYGIYRPNLKSLINHKLLKKHNIKLHGIYKNEDIPKIFSELDIVLIPSQMFESYSLIAREALINGKIIISSGMGGLSEVINNNHVIYNKTSSFDLAKKMFYVMNNLDEFNKNKKTINCISLEEQSKLYQKLYNNEK